MKCFQGIEAAPLQDDSLFEWVAKIKGLKDSVWEGTVCDNANYCQIYLYIF